MIIDPAILEKVLAEIRARGMPIVDEYAQKARGAWDDVSTKASGAWDDVKADPWGSAKHTGYGLIAGAAGAPMDMARFAYDASPTGIAQKLAAQLTGAPPELAMPEKTPGGTDWLLDKYAPAPENAGQRAAQFTGSLLSPSPQGVARGAKKLVEPMVNELTKGQIQNVVRQVKKVKEGGTIPLSGGDPPKSGYAFAKTRAGKQTTFDPATLRGTDVERFMRSQKMTGKDNLGMWLNPDDGLMYLDKSIVNPSRFVAKNEGNANKQLALWDLKRNEPVETDYGKAFKARTEEAARKEEARLAKEELKSRPVSVLKPKATVRSAHGARSQYEVYDNPQQIVSDSAKMVGPENPLLHDLFKTSRQGLDEEALYNQDPAKISSLLYDSGRAPPQHVQAVTNPQNAQRLQDVLTAAMDEPRLAGMAGWYQTGALEKRAVDLLGPEEGAKFAREHHLFASPMSANSTVTKEIAKGTYAHMLHRQGRLADFDLDLPAGMGNKAHKTAHMAGVKNIERSAGERFWDAANPSQKTPNYFLTKTGENHYVPTGDAHFVRATGLPDARPMVPHPEKAGEFVHDGTSIGKTEMAPIANWFNDEVTGPLGLTGGATGQPLMWGAMASRTGVKSAIGAPYLEIMADNIAKSAKRQGLTPQEALDNYILGKGDPRKAYLGRADPELLAAIAALGLGTGIGYGATRERE